MCDFYNRVGPNLVRNSKAGKICQFKKISADGLQHDLEGKPDVDRVGYDPIIKYVMIIVTHSTK